ncbi:hypothetical protein M3223_02295 [Paenibacillus pasadenensis]|uniref:Ger(x)C family spore germination protein n=1 Tax=Paenibacillus pasadenensis TaxID=217090 RepID=UPI00203EC78C|nr:hypothetical protein [Paenibacillus pasadenensis]MCM3746180.1 hypothetical protein [Paenibacillus pasadenensis]
MLRRVTLVLLCLAILSGCWSRRELNDLLIVLGIAVDWQDGKYLVSYQVVNPNEISTKRAALIEHLSYFIKRREIRYLKHHEP